MFFLAHALVMLANAHPRLHDLFDSWDPNLVEQDWAACIIPKGYQVRIVRKNSMDRKSQFLNDLCKPDMKRFVMCTLHADMHLSEGIFARLFRKLH
jgi:hypothetical protein